jgi:hypothetical protein
MHWLQTLPTLVGLKIRVNLPPLHRNHGTASGPNNCFSENRMVGAFKCFTRDSLQTFVSSDQGVKINGPGIALHTPHVSRQLLPFMGDSNSEFPRSLNALCIVKHSQLPHEFIILLMFEFRSSHFSQSWLGSRNRCARLLRAPAIPPPHYRVYTAAPRGRGCSDLCHSFHSMTCLLLRFSDFSDHFLEEAVAKKSHHWSAVL